MSKQLDISYRSLLNIALPLSLGAFVQFLVVLTDNLFLSEVGQDAINGAGNGGLLYITAVMLATGLSSGVQIFIARRKGAQRLDEVGQWFGAGMRTVLGLAIILYLVFLLFDAFAYEHWLDSAEITAVMSEFMRVRTLGFFVFFPTLILNSFYIGMAQTRILSVTMVLTAGVNILFDWLLIFGIGIFPELQHQGAALATLIAEFTGLAFLVLYTIRRFRGAEVQLGKGLFTRRKGLWRALLRLSVPLMLQQVLTMATWSYFFFMVEKIGGTELKVSHVVRNMYMLALVAIYGVGYTARTVVSTLIAEERQAELHTAIKRLILLNLAGSFLLCHGLWLYPEFIAGLFFEEGSAGFTGLIKSFHIVFFIVLLFSITGIFHNTVEGSGRTRAGLLIELISVSFYLYAVYLLTIVYPSPIHLVWSSDFVYFGGIGVLSLLFLWRSNWKYTQL
jgi:putative MATE family efflux protein